MNRDKFFDRLKQRGASASVWAGRRLEIQIKGFRFKKTKHIRKDLPYADELIGAQAAQAVIFYSPEQVEVNDTVTGERYAMQNVFVIHPQSVFEQFASLMEDVDSLIIALWQTMFHEVRHFVQCQIFDQAECKDLLLTEAVLARIARRNPSAAQCAYNHVRIYASYTGAYDGRKEIDAIIVGLIAVATLIVHSNGGEMFDFEKVRRALISTIHEYQEDSSLLNVF